MSAGATSPRIYTLPEIERATSTPSFRSDLIDAIAAAFAQYSSGGFNACPIQTMGAPPMARLSCASDDRYAAQVCVKSGYVTGAEHFVVKVAAGGHPMPNTGCMQVFSQRSGALEALLLDDGVLTGEHPILYAACQGCLTTTAGRVRGHLTPTASCARGARHEDLSFRGNGA